MMRMSVLSRFCFLAAILLQILLPTGCGRVLSVEPLSKLSDSQPDMEVGGTWVGVLPDGEATREAVILIVSSIGRDRQDAIYIEHQPGKILSSARFYLHPTRIGWRRFASIKLVPSAERNSADWKKFENNFVLVTYSVVSDRLRVSELNFEVFEHGVRNGALKGSIERKGIKWIELVDSTENIRKFVEENLDKIQNEKMVIEFRLAELKPK